jgi:uncharacterized membrane protein YeaQ/YmgE (transglycosylase-associated protein family)
MGILGWMVFGLVVGLLARAIMPGRDSMGLIGTIVLGIVGALLAGWVGTALGWYDRDSGAGMIAATVGALVVLGIYHSIVGRKRTGNVIDRNKNDRDRFAA